MVLTINPDRTAITIVSTLLNDFIGDEASYTNVTVEIFFNDTESSTTETYTDTDPIDGTTNVSTSAGTEYINPAFFGGTEFGQGVYHVIVTLTSEEEIQTEEGCLYVENGLKCIVDDYMMDEKKPVLERVLVGLKYRSLADADECPCKCNQKITIYNNLITIDNPCKTC